MAHIDLPPKTDQIVGIVQLFAFSPETAKPVSELADILLHRQREGSTLTLGERELIGTYTSRQNRCKFCTMSHCAVTSVHLQQSPDTIYTILNNPEEADISEKLKAVLEIAKQVAITGKNVTSEHVNRAKSAGATDIDIHDTIMIAALFCLCNRYVDGFNLSVPDNQEQYSPIGQMLAQDGYIKN